VSGPPQHCHEIEFHSYHALVSLPQWRHSFSLLLTLKIPSDKARARNSGLSDSLSTKTTSKNTIVQADGRSTVLATHCNKTPTYTDLTRAFEICTPPHVAHSTPQWHKQKKNCVSEVSKRAYVLTTVSIFTILAFLLQYWLLIIFCWLLLFIVTVLSSIVVITRNRQFLSCATIAFSERY
jgi:hypothetical protein